MEGFDYQEQKPGYLYPNVFDNGIDDDDFEFEDYIDMKSNLQVEKEKIVLRVRSPILDQDENLLLRNIMI